MGECAQGVWDCKYNPSPSGGQTCAAYDNAYTSNEGQEWLIASASIIAMVMAFGIGANDAANSWATSVGSKAVSLRFACIVGKHTTYG